MSLFNLNINDNPCFSLSHALPCRMLCLVACFALSHALPCHDLLIISEYSNQMTQFDWRTFYPMTLKGMNLTMII